MMVQHMWDHRNLPTEMSWTILVFLPKLNTVTQEIFQIEVMCGHGETVLFVERSIELVF